MTTIHLIDGNNTFRRTFEATGLIRGVLADIQMKYPVGDPVIYVWDGYHAKKSRRDLYPNYKIGRKRASDEFYKTQDLFKQVLLHTRCIQIEVPYREADDVIASLVRSRAGTNTRIRIESNDGDFLALCDGINVTLHGRDNVSYAHTDWTEVRLYKTLVGDPSDSIGGIRLFGPKSWEQTDKKLWLDYFENSTPINWDECAERLALKPSSLSWVKQNEKMLRVMWEIVEFLAVPDEDLQRYMQVGKPNLGQIETILKGYML